jgi:hypothetical protein
VAAIGRAEPPLLLDEWPILIEMQDSFLSIPNEMSNPVQP